MVDSMDRERRLRQELHALLARLSEGREPLDLVEDVPVVEDFVDDFAQAGSPTLAPPARRGPRSPNGSGSRARLPTSGFSGRMRIELRFTRGK